MEYREFDFWYYKLGKEGIELDSDLEWDPETISLSDMPMELTANIVEFLDSSARVSARAVSRNIRNIVDRKGPVFKHAKLLISPTECSMNFQSELSKRLIRATFPSETSTPDEFAEIEKANNIAFDEMAQIIRNPKLELEELQIETKIQDEQHGRANIAEVLTRVFKPISPVTVKEIETSDLTFPEVERILSHVEPGRLETIHFIDPSFDNSNSELFDAFIQSEHVRKAKELHITNIVAYSFPIQKLFHLERLYVTIGVFSAHDAINIRDVLLQSVNFQCFHFYVEKAGFDVVEIVRLFDPSYSGDSDGTIIYRAYNLVFNIHFSRHRLRFEKRVTNSYY
ncbi:F-box domain-containing protein [Caenorhabditis elegans]|uniref:F-box domain-containing protein n=1 Tax=Caenorhabditis elegans TaxID=6239 RepID=Q9U2N5_CAEEL|nr:F-box domain-containing protein [Caenorhabditis elegans]CAB60575.3 F-box domain-containing protein [Caenorhabditis elegans]|eukprot:NP_507538.3 F-box A protein [Caenorhabditis elegans]